MAELSFLFADLAGFAALTEAHGSEDAAATAERFEALAREALAPSLQLVKTVGDAVMVVGTDSSDAVRAGLAICERVESETRFPGVRVGIHRGEAVERSGDYFGSAVNIAARVAAYAHTGQVIATASVVELAHQMEDVGVEELGSVRLKHIPDPIPLFGLHDRSRSRAPADVVDPVCQMRLDADGAVARLPFADRTWFFCSLECARRFAVCPEDFVASPR